MAVPRTQPNYSRHPGNTFASSLEHYLRLDEAIADFSRALRLFMSSASSLEKLSDQEIDRFNFCTTRPLSNILRSFLTARLFMKTISYPLDSNIHARTDGLRLSVRCRERWWSCMALGPLQCSIPPSFLHLFCSHPSPILRLQRLHSEVWGIIVQYDISHIIDAGPPLIHSILERFKQRNGIHG